MARAPSTVTDRYIVEGLWDGETLPTLLASSFHRHADRTVMIHSEIRPYRGNFADILSAGRSLAASLRRRGIGPGDVVAFQLPNWAESLVCFVGATLSGATLVPIAPYYAEKDVRLILERSKARILIACSEFRGRDHLTEVESMRTGLGALEQIIVVGGDRLPHWATPFDSLVATPDDAPAARVDPASAAAIAWTSGTTAEPKGVILSHRALASDVRHHMAVALPTGRARLSGAPLSHVTGMLASALVPPYRGEDIHLTDVWDPGRVLSAMIEHSIGPGLYAPVFATSLLTDQRCTPDHLALMESASLGGSAVPMPLVQQLEAAGISVTRGYGCTEHPSVAMSSPSDPQDLRTSFDGPLLPGVEVRLVDEDDQDVASGERGEVLSRGPDLFSGYLDDELTESAFAPGGWFRTGDIAETKELGGRTWLRIVDRKKDIIIRAGINISSAEVESSIMTMDLVAEVAVIAVPDDRLGERVCAVVRPTSRDASIDLATLTSHLRFAGVTRQKWPEELILSNDPFPRTPSGKVRKADLKLLRGL